MFFVGGGVYGVRTCARVTLSNIRVIRKEHVPAVSIQHFEFIFYVLDIMKPVTVRTAVTSENRTHRHTFNLIQGVQRANCNLRTKLNFC